MAEPPFEEGAVQVRATLLSPALAVVSVGAPGTVAGMAERSFDRAPSPARFDAQAQDVPR